MFGKIVVPLDGSELSETALPKAIELARLCGAELLLLSVPSYPLFSAVSVTPMQIGELFDDMRSDVEKYLDHTTDTLKHTGIHASGVVRDGPVADTILDYVQEAGADLIVMSTHGRSGLTRWLIGSVADKVVRGAKVPVLLIRPNLHKEYASTTPVEPKPGV